MCNIICGGKSRKHDMTLSKEFQSDAVALR